MVKEFTAKELLDHFNETLAQNEQEFGVYGEESAAKDDAIRRLIMNTEKGGNVGIGKTSPDLVFTEIVSGPQEVLRLTADGTLKGTTSPDSKLLIFRERK